ncbi:hypothetical protein FJT64_006085 [Amphibalanus amphitrite]|uniref:Uncharacterized protein n=1 Tax=Amphibalanus amphitrite TaxID=1232801 RepID=A0A6A4VS12_AMPAM|nr:uncharacterized protein LOC122381380 [Amphibalanus amphitrite]KAF0296463.1 hypothetical protein FJT64_006085 [Amphibalanus amphitrite]
MAALTSLALVGAVPMTAEEYDRSRLLPFVHHLLNSEIVRRVLSNWTPPPPPETADAATSVTEAELAVAAARGRIGPPPDLVTCHQVPPEVTDYRGASAGEPTPAQLQVRLERLQVVRRAAGRDRSPGDVLRHSPPPPPGPDWGISLTPCLHEDAAEDADDEDSEDQQEGGRGGRSARRTGVGRELGAVADRLDAQRSLGTPNNAQSRRPKTPDEVTEVPGLTGGIASTAVTACGLAALGFLVRQMSSSDS